MKTKKILLGVFFIALAACFFISAAEAKQTIIKTPNQQTYKWATGMRMWSFGYAVSTDLGNGGQIWIYRYPYGTCKFRFSEYTYQLRNTLYGYKYVPVYNPRLECISGCRWCEVTKEEYNRYSNSFTIGVYTYY
ncbi:MAG: hypothetical protein JW724_00040 [Candidatus Altiarchaeota archaeon]|nr:hypothetical protein [Candidatus Altiarchaeota archaeon]